jgi:light-regulated signal transduction histidine kinase (bacteriophytochrome)
MMKKLAQINHELRQTIDQLQSQNQDLNDFCTIVAHDLRGSVSGIAQAALWLQAGVAQQLTEDANHRFDLLISRTLWMDTLITDLLAYSRMGKIEHQCEPVIVTQLLTTTIDFLVPPPAISINIGQNMPSFLTERVPLQIVFTNLISNAIKYRTQPQGSIEITVLEHADCYEFSIADDGVGIAPAYHQTIFEIFTTVPKLTSSVPQENSTGIGLAIAKKAVERNGGKISVESSVGVGSTFRFTWAKGGITQVAD